MGIDRLTSSHLTWSAVVWVLVGMVAMGVASVPFHGSGRPGFWLAFAIPLAATVLIFVQSTWVCSKWLRLRDKDDRFTRPPEAGLLPRRGLTGSDLPPIGGSVRGRAVVVSGSGNPIREGSGLGSTGMQTAVTASFDPAGTELDVSIGDTGISTSVGSDSGELAPEFRQELKGRVRGVASDRVAFDRISIETVGSSGFSGDPTGKLSVETDGVLLGTNWRRRQVDLAVDAAEEVERLLADGADDAGDDAE